MNYGQQQAQPMESYDQGVITDMERSIHNLSQTLAQYQLNFKEELERLEFMLRGIIRNEDGELVQIHDPIVNERGRTIIMYMVRTWMSKITAQSNYTDKEITRWCRAYWKELVLTACRHGEEWGLNQESYGYFVKNCVFSLQAVMNSAKDGLLRQVIGQSTRVIESYTTGQPGVKKMN